LATLGEKGGLAFDRSTTSVTKKEDDRRSENSKEGKKWSKKKNKEKKEHGNDHEKERIGVPGWTNWNESTTNSPRRPRRKVKKKKKTKVANQRSVAKNFRGRKEEKMLKHLGRKRGSVKSALSRRRPPKANSKERKETKEGDVVGSSKKSPKQPQQTHKNKNEH